MNTIFHYYGIIIFKKSPLHISHLYQRQNILL